MTLKFQYDNYQLSIDLVGDELKIILEPVKMYGKNDNAYIYSAFYKNSTIPSGISLIFSEKTQNWFKYIQFKGKQCIQVDINVLKSDQVSKVNQNTQFCQLPIFFTISLIEVLPIAKFQIIGTKQPYSNEKKLKKIIDNQQVQINYLQNKNYQILAKLSQVQQQNKQLKSDLRELSQKMERIRYNQQPKKKIHVQSQLQYNELQYVQPNFNINQHKKENFEPKVNRIEAEQPNQEQIQIHSQKSQKNEKYKQKDNRQDNRQVNKQHSIQKVDQQHKKTSLNTSNANSEKVVNDEKQSGSQQNRPTHRISNEKYQQIKKFVKNYCYFAVGQGNQENKAYCCLFCNKVFKQDEYLVKHFFMKHPAEINNNTDNVFLLKTIHNYHKKVEKVQKRDSNGPQSQTFDNRKAKLSTAINSFISK